MNDSEVIKYLYENGLSAFEVAKMYVEAKIKQPSIMINNMGQIVQYRLLEEHIVTGNFPSMPEMITYYSSTEQEPFHCSMGEE